MYTQNPSPLRFSSNFVESLIWLYLVDMQILKKIESLLGPFWADLRKSLKKYRKSRKNSHNFPNALVPSIIILQLFFSYQNKDLSRSYLINFQILQKNIFFGCTGCLIFLGNFRVATFGAKYLKTPRLRFS